MDSGGVAQRGDVRSDNRRWMTFTMKWDGVSLTTTIMPGYNSPAALEDDGSGRQVEGFEIPALVAGPDDLDIAHRVVERWRERLQYRFACGRPWWLHADRSASDACDLLLREVEEALAEARAT